MMKLRTGLVAIAAALAQAGPDELRAVAHEDQVTTLTLNEESHLEIDDLEIEIETETGKLAITGANATLTVLRRVVAEEEVRGAKDGRALEIARSFSEIMGETTILDEEGEEIVTDSSSRLEGRTVVFTRETPDDPFEAELEAGAEEPALLEGLLAEAVFAALLPPGPVEEGDEWEIDPAALRDLFAPLGDLMVLPSELEDTYSLAIDPVSRAAASLSGAGDVPDAWRGEIEARYAGSEVVEGVRVGTVELTFRLTTKSDRTERLRLALEADRIEAGVERLELDIELDGEGTFRWNLDAGRLRSLDLEAESRVMGHLAWTGDYFGMEDARITGRYEISGTTTFTATLE